MDANVVPLVSVIIPCYNTSRYVGKAVESALSQTYERVEIIVVNDGSTDDFESALAPYRDRVRIISQENRGLPAARNRGIEESNGELIAYLDADDVWHPWKLWFQVNTWAESPDIAFVHTDVALIDGEDRPVLPFKKKNAVFDGFCLKKLLKRNGVTVSSVLHSRSVLGETRFCTSLAAAEDWDMWLRLAQHRPVAYIRYPLTLYRWHAANMSHQVRRMQENIVKVMNRFLVVERRAGFRMLAKASRRKAWRELAHLQYEEGHLSLARKLFIQALPFHERAAWLRLAVSLVPEDMQQYTRSVITRWRRARAGQGCAQV